MFRPFRRRSPVAGVRFCDGCAEVTTAEQRARRRYDRGHTDAHGWQFTMLAGPNPGPPPVLALSTAIHDAAHEAACSGDAWFAADAPIRRVDVTATNLYGRLRQPSPGHPDLLTAHFDGVGDHPGLRQPGAADNGSGVAVVLEAARILAAALPEGAGLSVARHTGLPLVAGAVASDNRRYAGAGLAAIGIGAGMAGYHSPADTAERVEPATLAAITRLVVATAWFASTTPTTLRSSIGDGR